jgi:hypothetical protein
MNKKLVFLVLLILLVFSVSVMASDYRYASNRDCNVFDLGLVSMIPYRNLEAGEYSEFIPGIRMQFNLRPWFGLTTDIQARSFDFDTQDFDLVATVSPVVRAILGPVEPYFGIGTSYGINLNAGAITAMASPFRVNVRTGIDFKIVRWLSVGAEGNVWIPDPVSFVENFDADLLLDHLDVGLIAKFRF